MGLRAPSGEIKIPKLDEFQALQWHTLECELVTPMYGGGVEAATIDLKMPIRVSAIKGQLRFWWRLLAKNKKDETWNFNGDLTKIKEAEAQLFGGIGTKEYASLLFLKVINLQHIDAAPWARYEINPNNGQYRTLPTAENWANVPYVLFPAQGKRPGLPDSKSPSTLIKAGLTWDLQVSFDQRTTELQQQQVWESIRWWANFGGVGARTRRGLGAIRVQGVNITPISSNEVEKIGGHLILRHCLNDRAYGAWTAAVNKLQSFRQVNTGRASHDNRSRWPEPDAIRSLTGQTSQRHSQRVTQGDFFPRAAFGLPIIFKFKDDGPRKTDEPAQTSLQPFVNGQICERMASPLILRPYFNGKEWQAMALVLPHQYVDNLQLNLEQKSRDINKTVNYWHKDQVKNVRPIHEYDGLDALTAFLNYFEK